MGLHRRATLAPPRGGSRASSRIRTTARLFTQGLPVAVYGRAPTAARPGRPPWTMRRTSPSVHWRSTPPARQFTRQPVRTMAMPTPSGARGFLEASTRARPGRSWAADTPSRPGRTSAVLRSIAQPASTQHRASGSLSRRTGLAQAGAADSGFPTILETAGVRSALAPSRQTPLSAVLASRAISSRCYRIRSLITSSGRWRPTSARPNWAMCTRARTAAPPGRGMRSSWVVPLGLRLASGR